ncbi:MAG: carbohydrate kinase family protein [Gemmatimonadetes bacterium]|nr:carbohydrate kinase family protein [Gemmatimonadota bacterium]MYA77680.1 carbohydrate kinase family protein [Gemmatimonadota bacterium]MYG15620.1 carbohydrate kinase family protein [Gemmatimonadota bacterium]MYH19928.1 carbohydrate kinase family protein [Gemmatimonadota bacterium]MYK99560.1 carbohydrate kinase family protein [Gemmatimonadota bacterium]
MRVGIIGLINHDTIFMAGGRRIQDLGGILYNTTVMADLVGEGDALYPISRIGTDCYDAMHAMLDPRPVVSNRGVRVSRTGTSRNRIRYDEDMEKVEQLTNHIGPIPFEQIEPFLDLDALLVNFIVGDDISLETMAAVRERATGLLYLDVHNLCLGIDAEGYRRRRAPEDWQRWIEMFDVIQMNEVEARLLAGVAGAGDQAADAEDGPGGLLEAEDDFIAFGRSVIALGPSVCVITRGPIGPVTVYRTDRETRAIAIPSEPAREVVDTTGCGDAFAAGFVVEYADTEDPVGATRLANRVASVNCTVAGLPEPGTFSDIRPTRPR